MDKMPSLRYLNKSEVPDTILSCIAPESIRNMDTLVGKEAYKLIIEEVLSVYNKIVVTGELRFAPQKMADKLAKTHRLNKDRVLEIINFLSYIAGYFTVVTDETSIMDCEIPVVDGRPSYINRDLNEETLNCLKKKGFI